MGLTLENRAKLACLFAGVVWGIYWIPLRALEDAGMHPLWTTPVYFLVPLVVLMPVIVWRWRVFYQGGWGLQITILSSGIALAFYSTAIIYTDVVRAILLFYLMPVWSAFLARIFLGERILPVRALSLALAMLGMMTIFGLGLRFPLPENLGDWMGLAGGMAWAVTMVRLRGPNQTPSLDLTTGFLIWGLILSGGAALILASVERPPMGLILPELVWLLPFALVLVVPGTFASLWGPKFLNPAVAGLLFMSEIIVGAASAALFAGEPIGNRELTGIGLIILASMIEPIWELYGPKSRRS